MNPFYWLVRKDLALFLSDFTGALITVIMPAALALLLGAIFQPPEGHAPLPVLLVDEDHTSESGEWTRLLQARQDLDVQFANRRDAASRVSRGLSPVAVFLPQGLEEGARPDRMLDGRPSLVELLIDPARQVEGMRVRGVLQEVAAQRGFDRLRSPTYLQEWLNSAGTRLKTFGPLMGERLFQRTHTAIVSLEAVVEELAPLPRIPMPWNDPGALFVQLVEKEVPSSSQDNRQNYHAHSHAFAGMVCMFLLFFALERSKLLLREKEAGTLFRIRTTPVDEHSLLVASLCSTAIIALASALMTFAIGWAAADVVVRGSFLGFLLVNMAMALMVGAFGLLMAQLAKTQQMLTSLGTLIVLVMSFLGGAWAPSFVLSELLQQIGAVMPTTFATQGLAAMTWRGLPIDAALIPILGLVGFALAFYLAAAVLRRRSLPR